MRTIGSDDESPRAYLLFCSFSLLTREIYVYGSSAMMNIVGYCSNHCV